MFARLFGDITRAAVQRMLANGEILVNGEQVKASYTVNIGDIITVEEEEVVGEINPYTGREYETNTVRAHGNRIGYVQVYDQTIHKWMDMTEWAFMGYQERKKALLGSRYEPPTYLE